MFACLGWGSLIWDSGTLPIVGMWQENGPALPIEFARQSRDGRITLVVDIQFAAVRVLWVSLAVATVEEAQHELARREGVRDPNLIRSVGLWSDTVSSTHSESRVIGEWARTRGLRGVVWTALRPRFGGQPVTPSEAEVIAYLAGLRGETARVAEEYVRRTPAQISTPYRQAIERELGWTMQVYGER
jgi:hypothetical protein